MFCRNVATGEIMQTLTRVLDKPINHLGRILGPVFLDVEASHCYYPRQLDVQTSLSLIVLIVLLHLALQEKSR